MLKYDVRYRFNDRYGIIERIRFKVNCLNKERTFRTASFRFGLSACRSCQFFRDMSVYVGVVSVPRGYVRYTSESCQYTSGLCQYTSESYRCTLRAMSVPPSESCPLHLRAMSVYVGVISIHLGRAIIEVYNGVMVSAPQAMSVRHGFEMNMTLEIPSRVLWGLGLVNGL